MTISQRVMIGIAGASLCLLGLGFVLFANSAMRESEERAAKAEGIVVLTGGQTRITEAARLLHEKRGQRLLISGVNPKTGRESLIRLSGLTEEEFACCVDLDYEARDTIGNAAETRRWAEGRGYTSLIVVTASYHMPRSLAELAREMPGITLIPHAVVPKGLRETAWWLDRTTTRLLLSEYLKFLPSAARLAAARALGPWSASSIASATTVARAKS